VRFFDKYYRVLNLPPNSDDEEIKRAYRKLAKIYHPDKSGDSATETKFIRVNQAYEILMRRHDYIRAAIKKHQQRRKKRPNAGRRPPNGPKERAKGYAEMRFEEFEKSPIYRTAKVVNSASTFVFIAVGCIMILSPVWGYYRDTVLEPKTGSAPEFHYFPMLLGISFLYGVWYFVFKQKEF
jgi:hypothetical protein